MVSRTNRDKLKTILDPDRTMVVVIDMQNDFCAPKGAMDVACKNKPGEDLSLIQEMAPVLSKFLAGARQSGVKVGVVQNLPLGRPAPFRALFGSNSGDYCQPGSWGADFYEVTAPHETDMRFVKHRYSLFTNPNFPTYLHMNGVETLVVTGVGTPVCVESTVRDGFMADFHVVVPRDCVATYSRELHQNSLRIMARNFAWIVDSSEILDIWQRAHR